MSQASAIRGRNIQTRCRHLKASSGIKAARSSLVLASPQPASLSRGCFVVTVGSWEGGFTGNTSSTTTREVIHGTLMQLKLVLFPFPADRWLKTPREPRWIFFFFPIPSAVIRSERAELRSPPPPEGRDEP